MPQFTIDPLASPGECDALIAMGVQSPGVATLMSGGTRRYNWDIKQAPGVQGYVMTYRGWKGGELIVFRFAFFLDPGLTEEQARETSQVRDFYNTWIPLFAIDARKIRPQPVSVYQPQLAANDIDALVCESIGPMTTDGNMKWWVDMSFYEFRPPRLIPVQTPSGATAKLGVPTPQSAIDIAIANETVLAQRPL